MQTSFTVIKGGKEIPTSSGRKVFVSGFVTDTRLMGVIGMELVWDVYIDGRIDHLNQIFYLDSEEYGLESYTEAYGTNPAEIIIERERLLGALGGRPVPINEKEARFLIQTHIKLNGKYDQELPEGRNRYQFVLSPEQTLSPEEYADLYSKICVCPKTAEYTINHYIMRCVSGDAEGTAQLCAGAHFEPGSVIKPGDVPVFELPPIFSSIPATLCRNSIEPHGSPDSSTYICESLIEYNSGYRLLNSEIKLSEDCSEVISSEKVTDFRITGAEASMMMNRSEFISVYDIVCDDDEFREAFSKFTEAYTETSYDTGKLCIDFNDTNSHVGNRIYKINDDIHSMYFLTDYGQIIIMAYDLETVNDAEMRMFLSLYPHPLSLSMKYEFKEPVLYEFIKSDCESFSEFIIAISGFDPDSDN